MSYDEDLQHITSIMNEQGVPFIRATGAQETAKAVNAAKEVVSLVHDYDDVTVHTRFGVVYRSALALLDAYYQTATLGLDDIREFWVELRQAVNS